MRDTFETERLRLRRPTPEDAESIFHRYAQDPEVTRHLSWAPHADVEETREFLRRCEEWWGEASRYPWAITLLGSGEPGGRDEVVGMIELRPGDPRDSVGFVLMRELWGRGYVTEALRAVLEVASNDVGMETVGACCHVDNRASARVMEKVGMRLVSREECCGMYPNVEAGPEESYFYTWTPGDPCP